MNERVYSGGVTRLRSQERLERLEVEKVVDLILSMHDIKTMLDIGTGSGVFAEKFYNKNILVTGIDSNPEMIEAAKSFLPDCKFELASAESLPFQDSSFDMVFMGLVFHEVDNYKQVLEEAKRVVKKIVAIYDWNYEVQEFGPPIEHRLKPEFIEQLAKEVGFSSYEVHPLKNLSLYILKV